MVKTAETKAGWWYADPWGIDICVETFPGNRIGQVRIRWSELLASAIRQKARVFMKKAHLLEYKFRET